MSNEARSSITYMPHLDAVRALAIGLVLIEHYGGQTTRDYFPASAGALGVNLFFVLSGFLISSILMTEFDTTRSSNSRVLFDFYARRALRLIPIYYVTIGILCYLNLSNMQRDWEWHIFYISNFLIAAGGPMTVFWSLSVEEQFYLFLPILMLLIASKHRLSLAIGLVAAGVVCRLIALRLGIDELSLEVSLPGKLEVLGAGVIIGVITHRQSGVKNLSWFSGSLRKKWGIVAVGLLLVQILIFYTLPDGNIERYLTFASSTGIMFTWVILQATRGFSGAIGWYASHIFVRYIGRISYGIYIIHTFVPQWLMSGSVRYYIGTLPLPILAILSLVISVSLASLSWFLLEQPILNLRRYFHGMKRYRSPVPTRA